MFVLNDEHNLKFKLTFFFLFVIGNLFAQNFNYNGKQYLNETQEFIKAPFKWNSNSFIYLGTIVASTYAMTYIDEDIRGFVTKNNTDYKNFYYEFGRIWGEPYVAPIVGGLFMLHGSLNNNDANMRTGYEVLQSFSYNIITTGILKIGFGRARPYTNESSNTFKPFSSLNDDYLALPSGHTSIAFALSSSLAFNSKSDVLKVISFIPATNTAISRIAYNKHWLSDTFMGAAIGIFIAKFSHELHEKNNIEGVESIQNPPSVSFAIPLF